jgi:general L-amino acid transport system permease protein
VHRDHHGRVPDDVADDVGHHELVQQASGDQGALMSAVFEPTPARTPPIPQSGPVVWLRNNLFADWKSALTTVILVGIALAYLPSLIDWAIVQAVLQPNAEICQQARGTGACWGVVVREIPADHLRALSVRRTVAAAAGDHLLVGLLMASCVAGLLETVAGAAVGRRLAAFFALMQAASSVCPS